MLKVSRLFAANYGHSDAMFAGNVIDFRRIPSRIMAESVMIHAPNGNGKSSILSMMLHMFVPERDKFVQTLQQSKHKFWDYIQPSKPAFFVMELSEAGDGLLKEAVPKYVIGSVIWIAPTSGGRTEEFFLLEPNAEYGFDDLEFIKEALEKKRLSWKNADASAWLSELRNRASLKKVKFKTEHTLEGWKSLLKNNLGSLVPFRSQVEMASSEGGLENWLKVSSSVEMLKKIFTLIIDEDDVSETLLNINQYLTKYKDLPQRRCRLENCVSLREFEQSFLDANNAFKIEDESSRELSSRVKGADIALRAEEAKAAQEEVELGKRVEDSQREIIRLETALDDALTEREAVRIAHVRKERCRLETSQASYSLERSEFDRHLKASTASVRFGDVIDGQRELDRIEDEISQHESGDRDRRVPLELAGSRFSARLDLEIEAGNRVVAQHDDALNALESRLKNVDLSSSLANEECRKRRSQIESAEKDVASAKEHLQKWLPSVGSGNVANALLALESYLSEMTVSEETFEQRITVLNSDLDIARSDLAAKKSRDERLTSNRSAILSEKTAKQSKLSALESRLQEIEESYPTAFALFDVDSILSDQTRHALDRLVSDADKFVEGKRRDLKALETRMRSIESLGAFVDKDVEAAVEYCRKIGVSDVGPYANWISENVPEMDAAKRIVESNLDVALGIRVYSVADLEKIRQAFDRNECRLEKPVAVTVVRDVSEFCDHPRDHQIILSAASDYAYHKQSRISKIEELKREISALLAEIERADADSNQKNALRGAVADLASAIGEHGVTKASLSAGLADLEAKLSRIDDEIDQLRGEILEDETRIDELKDELASIQLKCRETVKERQNLTTDLTKARTLIERTPSMEELVRLGEEADQYEKQASEFLDQKVRLSEQTTAEITRKATLVAEIGKIRNEKNEIVYVGDVNIADLDIKELSIDVCRLEYQERLATYNSHSTDDQELSSLRERAKIYRDHVLVKAVKSYEDLLKSYCVVNDEEFRALVAKYAAMLTTELDLETHRLQNELAKLEDKIGKNAIQIARLQDAEKPLGELKPEIQLNAKRSVEFDLDRLIVDGAYENAETRCTTVSAELRDMNEELNRNRERLSSLSEIKNCAVQAWLRLKAEDLPVGIQAEEVRLPACGEWTEFAEKLEKQHKSATKKLMEMKKKAINAHEAVLKLKNAEGFEIDMAFKEFLQRIEDYGFHSSHSNDVIGQLENVIESGQQEFERIVAESEDVVKDVKGVAKLAIDYMAEATKVKIPDNVHPFGGNPILMLPAGIQIEHIRSLPIEDIARSWLREAECDAEKMKPLSIAALSTTLLTRIAFRLGKSEFGLRLLKPVVQSNQRKYELAHEITGSGGQTITAALLLNILANYVRSKGADKSAFGFIILDNPVGKANALALVQTQLEVAKAFGIQVISTTCINDLCINAYQWMISFYAERRIDGGKNTAVGIEYDGNKECDNSVNFVSTAHISLHGNGEPRE